jgi:hypothetical protein
VEPVGQRCGVLRHAGLLVRLTAARVVAALVDDVLARYVDLLRVRPHLDDLLVRDAAEALVARPLDVLADEAVDVGCCDRKRISCVNFL